MNGSDLTARRTPTPAAREPRAKGTLFATVSRQARTRGAEFSARLEPRTRELLAGSLLAGSWYPETCLRELLEALGGPALSDRLGRDQALADLQGVYRSLFRPGDAGATLAAFSMIWSLYHDSGAALCERLEPNHARVTVRGFALPSSALCAFTAGWLAQAAEQASGVPARVDENLCRARGASRCAFDVRLGQQG
jgi:hypothetical protein